MTLLRLSASRHPSEQACPSLHSPLDSKVHQGCIFFPLALSIFFFGISQVSGSLPAGPVGLYRSAERVGDIHLGALRKLLSGKPVWVGTDEWTASQPYHGIACFLLPSPANSTVPSSRCHGVLTWTYFDQGSHGLWCCCQCCCLSPAGLQTTQSGG